AFQVHNLKVFSTYHLTVGCWLLLVAPRLSASLQTCLQAPDGRASFPHPVLGDRTQQIRRPTGAQSAKSVMQLSMQQTGRCSG
ncbi:hypothetical protein GQ607_013963, partial [Colletotrichum asianum]